jgi:hypothetical protein
VKLAVEHGKVDAQYDYGLCVWIRHRVDGVREWVCGRAWG